MRLYDGTIQQFRCLVNSNKIADLMNANFYKHYGRNVSTSEYRSWQNSLNFLKNVVDMAGLVDNHIVLEYRIPVADTRIDALIFGESGDRKQIVLTELKQWSNDDVTGEMDGNILIRGYPRPVAHPSQQVEGYYFSLLDNLVVFQEDPHLSLLPTVYLHNYSSRGYAVLYNEKFRGLIERYPLYSKEQADVLAEYLRKNLGEGDGRYAYDRFTNSAVKPSKILVEHFGKIVGGQQVFTLIDDQIPVMNAIRSKAVSAASGGSKSVIIVKGGPGTGKSVIALETMAELLRKGKNVFYVTGSSAFTNTLRKIAGSRVKHRFGYFFSFTKHADNSIDVIMCDEAHRLRKNSSNYGVPSHLRSSSPQVEDIIRPARLSVFFLDENQIVRPGEVGSVDLIREAAGKMGASVYEFELVTQFRCGGSSSYLSWLDATLEIGGNRQKAILLKSEPMEFKIFDSPHELKKAIDDKNAAHPNRSRLVAGFCWKWSDPRPDGTLVEDVVIGDFKMPWENKKEFWKWATDPSGMNQIGTVYTAQGFEFDYVGVIFGDDLVYRNGTWVGQPWKSYDRSTKSSDDYVKHAKNVYRVLMSRAHRGVYVYFMDDETRRYFESRIEGHS